MSTYDLVIVGSGPGGYVAAIRAGQLGLKVALVERDAVFGGTCLHRGCIPTKALLHDAYLFEQIQSAGRFGIEVEGVRLDFAKVMKHKTTVVRKLALGIEGLLKKNKVKTIKGSGTLAGPGCVEVDGKRIEAKAVILATGSEVSWLPGMEPDGKSVITSDQALELDAVPESMAVIGAGAVGMEFASIYARFGSHVTVVELKPQVLPLEDEEIARGLERILAKKRMKILTGAKVESVGPNGVTASVGGKKETIACEKVLVAVGRKPNTSGIGLETTGAKLEGGFIKVNEYMETAEPGLYAIGDVVVTPPLAHVASAEGILAVERIAGREVRPINPDRIPSVTYCDPQVASAGLTEKEARARGFDVRCGVFPFMGIGKASIEGRNEGFVKIVGETRRDEILGVHVLHAHAGEMISEAVAVLNGEMTAEDLAHAIHPHPTLSEGIAEATHAYFGNAIHL